MPREEVENKGKKQTATKKRFIDSKFRMGTKGKHKKNQFTN